MGGFGCCDAVLSFHCAAEVDASPETVASIWGDLARIPSLMDHILSVEILAQNKSTRGLHEGLKWREERLFYGRTATIITTITNVEYDENRTRILSFSYISHMMDGVVEVKHVDQVGSLSIKPLSEDKSLIVLTVNSVIKGWYGCLHKFGIGYILQRCYVRPYYQKEVDQLAAVAEKLQLELLPTEPDAERT